MLTLLPVRFVTRRARVGHHLRHLGSQIHQPLDESGRDALELELQRTVQAETIMQEAQVRERYFLRVLVVLLKVSAQLADGYGHRDGPLRSAS